MNTITLQSLQIKSALTTTKPTPSPIMVEKEDIKDNILQNIYPVMLPESHIPDDIVAIRIDGMLHVRVAFVVNSTKQLLSKTTQLKYRIKPQELVNAINRNNYEYTFGTMADMLGIPCFKDEIPMYVLTNTAMNFGAGLILNKSILRHILDTLNEDIYILPSSVHELIVIPSSMADDAQFLTDMVYSINQSQVEPKDRLSNDVYRVDYTTMKFRTIQHQP